MCGLVSGSAWRFLTSLREESAREGLSECRRGGGCATYVVFSYTCTTYQHDKKWGKCGKMKKWPIRANKSQVFPSWRYILLRTVIASQVFPTGKVLTLPMDLTLRWERLFESYPSPGDTRALIQFDEMEARSAMSATSGAYQISATVLGTKTGFAL